MKSIAVFCGSRDGASSVYREGAIRLGKELAQQEIALVYGGSSVGLMGRLRTLCWIMVGKLLA